MSKILPFTYEFLDDLKANNNREWFAANKKIYEKVKENYYGFAGELLAEVQKFDSHLDGLTHKDCVFRINRDIRFSADKSPYKTNLGIVLTPGGKKVMSAGYYVHIEPGASFVGGGLWMPPADILLKVRKEISYFYDELKEILTDVSFTDYYKGFDAQMTQKLSRPPKGFSAEDPAIDLLKLKSFIFSKPISNEILLKNDFKNHIVTHFKAIKPALDFINRGIMSDENGGL